MKANFSYQYSVKKVVNLTFIHCGQVCFLQFCIKELPVVQVPRLYFIYRSEVCQNIPVLITELFFEKFLPSRIYFKALSDIKR